MVCCCTVLLVALVHFVALALYFRITTGKYRIKKRLTGKTYVVTGATAGVGKESALKLALNGAKVIMACRNLQKAERVRAEIVRKAFNNDIHIVRCDLSDFDSVKECAQELNNAPYQIDVLMNNAGVMYTSGEKRVTKNGLEEQIQANHLGHFLLTNLLIEKLKKSNARIVNVSSIAGLTSKNFGRSKDFNPSDLNFQTKPYQAFKAYAYSKLSNILFTRELSKRLEGTGVTVNCCHPGAVETDLSIPNAPQWFIRYVIPAFTKMGFMKTSAQGAMTQLYLATSDEVDNVSGAYFADCVPGQPTVQALDNKLAMDLWTESERIVKDYM